MKKPFDHLHLSRIESVTDVSDKRFAGGIAKQRIIRQAVDYPTKKLTITTKDDEKEFINYNMYRIVNMRTTPRLIIVTKRTPGDKEMEIVYDLEGLAYFSIDSSEWVHITCDSFTLVAENPW